MINPPSETIEQQKLVQWLRIKKIAHTSMPNENKYGGILAGILTPMLGKIRASQMASKITSSIEAKMRAEGKQKGYPDIIIDEPNKYYHGLRIELKRARKQLKTKLSTSHTKVSPEQEKWLERLNDNGYYAVVAYGAKEAIEIIEEYMENRV